MIIGIDGNEANVEKRVGIGEYAYEILRQFSKLKDYRYAIEKDLEFRIYLKNKPLNDLPKENDNWKYRIIKPGKLWTQWRLPLDLYLNNPKPDVFFTPSHYAPRFCPVPSIVSIMDLSFLHFPDLFDKRDLYQLTNWTEYSVKKADKIITISNSSKNDIIKRYKVGGSGVIVTHLGIKEKETIDTRIYTMSQLKNKYEISENYVLFVGTLQPRKNIVRLVDAFSKALKNANLNSEKRKDLQLVIVGKKGWMFDEIIDSPKRFGIEDRVKFLELVNDEELLALYKHAECLVLPSLYEGFGLPVLEAMKAGCPVIASNVSSLPEAGGDACLYVDPEDTIDISTKIIKLVGNEKLRQELIEKGYKQSSKFSWEKTAKETLEVLIDVGGKQ